MKFLKTNGSARCCQCCEMRTETGAERAVWGMQGQHGPVEAHENGSLLPPEGVKHWQADFVLAEEDFPTLPSAHSQAGTPIKGVPKPAAGWVAPEAKGVQSTS